MIWFTCRIVVSSFPQEYFSFIPKGAMRKTNVFRCVFNIAFKRNGALLIRVLLYQRCKYINIILTSDMAALFIFLNETLFNLYYP